MLECVSNKTSYVSARFRRSVKGLLAQIIDRLGDRTSGSTLGGGPPRPPLSDDLVYPLTSDEALYRLEELVREDAEARGELETFLAREVDDRSVAYSVAGVISALLQDDVVRKFNFQGRNGKLSLRKLVPIILGVIESELIMLYLLDTHLR